jgi:hypothetical protein
MSALVGAFAGYRITIYRIADPNFAFATAMPDYSDQQSAFRSVQAVTAQTRLQAIKARLSLALTFCSLAETELDYGELAAARKLLRIVRQTAESVSSHLEKPNYVPAEHLAELNEQLMRLESRMSSITVRLMIVD